MSKIVDSEKIQTEKYINEYLRVYTDITPEKIEFIRPHLTVKRIKNKGYYLHHGDVQKNMGYVIEGLLRRYYINDKGNKITTGFIKESEYATDYPAFLKQRETKYFIQCLEPSVIVEIPYDKIMEGYTKYSSGQRYGRMVAERSLSILTERIEGFLFNTAEERYLKFIEENPSLINRVSLTHLASFLGIERQSLSRIRKRLSEK